ncbi:hypothetical protein, partial [Kocuria himachalensis]
DLADLTALIDALPTSTPADALQTCSSQRAPSSDTPVQILLVEEAVAASSRTPAEAMGLGGDAAVL